MLGIHIKHLEENDPSFTCLYIPFGGITDVDAVALASALEKNTYLESLNLLGNNIGDGGTKALARCLKTNKSITYLNLYYNKMGSEGAQTLATSLKSNTSLTALDLSGNSRFAGVATGLDQAIKNNEYICYAEYYNRSQEIAKLLANRQNNIKQLIQDYKNGNTDLNQLVKFSKQIEYVAQKSHLLNRYELNTFQRHIRNGAQTKFIAKINLAPNVQERKNELIEPFSFIMTTLDADALKNLNIALTDDLYEERQALLEQERLERKRQRNELLNRVFGIGIIGCYAAYKLATAFCREYLKPSSAIGELITVCDSNACLAYIPLESKAAER
ncbi:MAG: hypothetical protein ACK5WS_00070 [Alphaproteobacteria bacterium]|nr:hypothetical protein [Candidatus Jidaibacter sp.]